MAVAAGVSEIDALVLATANPADYHGFRQLGALAPGYQADVLCFDELSGFRRPGLPSGATGGRRRRVLEGTVPATRPDWMRRSIHLDAPPGPRLRPGSPTGARPARSVSSRDPSPRPRSSVTRVIRHRAWPASPSSSGTATTGRVGLGWVRGFGIERAPSPRRRARRAQCHGVGSRNADGLGRWPQPSADWRPRGGQVVVDESGQVSPSWPCHRRPDERAAAREVADGLERLVAVLRRLGVTSGAVHAAELPRLSVLPELRSPTRPGRRALVLPGAVAL